MPEGTPMTSLSRSLAIALLLIFFASPSRAQGADGAVYVLTYIDLQPNRVAGGMTLLKAYRRESRKEAGARDITLVAENGRPNRLVIAETWQDQGAYAA